MRDNKLLVAFVIASCAFMFSLGRMVTFIQYREDFAIVDKYKPVEEMFKQLSTRPYDATDYNCVNFSEDGREMLKKNGIESSIIVGDDGSGTFHAYLGIWMEPQNGDFVTGYDFVGVRK